MAKKKYKEFKQGTYNPINPNKYKGSKPICYRSSWELAFFKYCDSNPSIIQWGSESVVVPYVCPTDGNLHRYFVDFYIKVKQGDTVTKFLIEIKPKRQTQKPTPSPRKKQQTLIKEQLAYIKNTAKWESAKTWANKNGYKFLILTEEELKKLNCM